MQLKKNFIKKLENYYMGEEVEFNLKGNSINRYVY